MLKRSRVYLDNAATSWPKPTLVCDVVDDYQRRLGVSVGRGAFAEADVVGEVVEKTRMAVARLIGAGSPDRIIFTLNGTDSLNLAIHGILKAGDHVVTTVVEHNSVLRPLRRLEKLHGVEVSRVHCDEFGIVSPMDIRAAIRPNTKLIVVTHASNVTGAIQQVEAIGLIAREHGILFLVDASQTLGHISVSVSEIGADLLAAPGHKGLLGPLGTGILYLRPGVEELLDSVRQGGTGSSSSSEDQPETLPEKYESGSHNAPGIVGLGAGIEYVEQRGLVDIRRHAIQLTDQLIAGLSNIPGVTVYGPRSSEDRIGVVSVTFADQDATSVARRLEEEFRIQVRGGFQCAALMHRSLGTIEQQGTVRFSVGPFNTPEDIESAIEAARKIAGSSRTASEPVTCPCVSAVREHNQATVASSFVLPAAAEIGSVATLVRSGTDVAEIPGLRELWGETLGDPRVCIAILDGPVDLSHPAFIGSKLTALGDGVVGTDAATEHGTHIASVIYGNHQSPVKGIAPHCSGVVIPIFRTQSDGTVEPCSQASLAKAINQAVDYSKKLNAEALVINISGGQFSESGDAQSALKQAISKCDKKGILVVAAAGNEGCDCLHVPGALPSVLTVGAMSVTGEPLQFSNWGQKYNKQGVLAVGENILGASPSGKTVLNSGTSFATPIVSGIAALLLSMQLKAGVRPSAKEVRQAIVTSALGCDIQETVDCRRLLAGRLSIIHSITSLRFGETASMIVPQNVEGSPGTVVTPSCSTRENPAVSNAPKVLESLVVPAAASRSVSSQTSVTPSGCGCGGGAATYQLVFAIGRLAYDFETVSGRQAMKRRLKEDGEVQTSSVFMRHLFGVNKVNENGPGRLKLHEAKRFFWVLESGGKPIYAIQPPQGVTEASDLESIAFDYLEQEGLLDREGLAKTKDNLKLTRIEVNLLPEADRPTYFGFAGYLTGETVSLQESGRTVPVLIPECDQTDSWNLAALKVEAAREVGIIAFPEEMETNSERYESLKALISKANRLDNLEATDDEKKDAKQVLREFSQLSRIVDLLHKFIEPTGDTAEKRAKNFVASHAVQFAAKSISQSSEQKLILQALDVIGDVGGRYPDEQVIQIRAVYADIANPKDINYAQDYFVNVSQPKPVFESEPSPLGFA